MAFNYPVSKRKKNGQPQLALPTDQIHTAVHVFFKQSARLQEFSNGNLQ